jgi:Ca2+-binding RTX toxin-like protein
VKKSVAALGLVGVLLSTGLVAQSGQAVAAAAPMCFGMPATITGTGFIKGTRGRDVIVAHGNAQVHGRGGDDLICGAPQAYGEGGRDHIRYSGTRQFGQLFGGDGNDHVFWISASSGVPELAGGGGNDHVGGRDGIQRLAGGRGHDTITAGLGSDYVSGNSGFDILYGGSGDDTIDGGFGDDQLHGNFGADQLNGHEGDDIGYGGHGVDSCASVEHQFSC